MAAGPIFNFLLGFVLSLVVVAFSGTDLPVIQEVMEDSAAMEAGLEAGDVITKINGESIHLYREVALISSMNHGAPLTITYKRDGVKDTITIHPRYDQEAGRYFIGIIGGGEYHDCTALEVFPYAGYETIYWFKATVKSLANMVGGQFSKDDISGPVIILTFMSLATLLTVNLGVVNLLPIPALDGGRLVFLIIEAVRGKPVPPEKEGIVHLIGIILLMILMVFVLFNDISRFFR